MKYFTLVLILLFHISNKSFSQNSINRPTRQQTEAWIIEKLNKYVEKEKYFSNKILDKEYSTTYKNIKFNLTNDFFTITSNVTEYISNRYLIDGPEITKKEYTETVNIPLNKITNNNFIKDGYIFFESNYNSFVLTNSNGNNSSRNWFGTRINAFEEENFSTRFNKAMNHLLSFVKKTNSTEIF
jgi:hypothetical protein